MHLSTIGQDTASFPDYPLPFPVLLLQFVEPGQCLEREVLAQEPGQQVGELFTYLFMNGVAAALKDV